MENLLPEYIFQAGATGALIILALGFLILMLKTDKILEHAHKIVESFRTLRKEGQQAEENRDKMQIELQAASTEHLMASHAAVVTSNQALVKSNQIMQETFNTALLQIQTERKNDLERIQILECGQTALREELKKRETELAQANKRISALEKELADKDRRILALEADNKAKDDRISSLENERNKIAEEKDGLVNQLAEEIETLRERLNHAAEVKKEGEIKNGDKSTTPP